MRNKNNLVQAWLNKADKDLLTAKREFSFEDPVIESVCFHSQQATEKYIKAYLVYKDIPFPKSHDIGKLIDLLDQNEKELHEYKDIADTLTDYGVEIRYPDINDIPEKEEAKEALAITIKFRELITSKIRS
ncbi:MAG: HEPN domain-containing protein [Bacteroidota bacterium]